MKKKKKKNHDLSMLLFSHEEMTGNSDTKPFVEQHIPIKENMETKESQSVVSVEEFHENDNSFEIDSRILTKEMFFAIRHLKRLDMNQVRMIAMEMAMVWQNGNNLRYSYSLQSLPDVQMDYHQFIAYYYCSFNMAFPNMMNKIQLPYEKEFQNAMYELGGTHGGAS